MPDLILYAASLQFSVAQFRIQSCDIDTTWPQNYGAIYVGTFTSNSSTLMTCRIRVTSPGGTDRRSDNEQCITQSPSAREINTVIRDVHRSGRPAGRSRRVGENDRWTSLTVIMFFIFTSWGGRGVEGTGHTTWRSLDGNSRCEGLLYTSRDIISSLVMCRSSTSRQHTQRIASIHLRATPLCFSCFSL